MTLKFNYNNELWALYLFGQEFNYCLGGFSFCINSLNGLLIFHALVDTFFKLELYGSDKHY